MKLRKIIASVLCVALAAGFAGCDDSKKSQEAIEGLISDYAEALSNFDGEAVTALTNWEEDDTAYTETAWLLNGSFYKESCGETAYKVCKAVAATVSVEYESEDIKINDTKASVKVTYKIADWKSIYEDSDYEYDEALKNVKKSKDILSFNSKLSFELTDGEWKISKINDLYDVFAYTQTFPYIDVQPDPVDPDPTDTDPTDPTEPTDTQPADISVIYDQAVKEYLWYLDQYRYGIEKIENSFNTEPVGIYDLDGDGVPELYYITEHMEDYSGIFHFCTYDDYSGEVFIRASIPDVIYQAQGGGYYIIYITGDELILTYTHGEEALFHVESDVYSLSNWELLDHYRRDVYYEYDPVNDLEIYTYEYYMNDDVAISQDEYNAIFKDFVNRTTVVVASNYSPLAEDVEYPLNAKPRLNMMTYDKAIEYLESLI